MKRELVLIGLGLFLIVFMIRNVQAENNKFIFLQSFNNTQINCSDYIISIKMSGFDIVERNKRNITFSFNLADVNPGGFFYLLCGRNYTSVLGEESHFESTNLLTMDYRNDTYQGYHYGSENCIYHDYLKVFYCKERISFNYINIINSSENIEGHVVISIEYDNETKSFSNNLNSEGGIYIKDKEQICENYDQRISALESIQQTIMGTLNSIQTSISNIFLALTGHTTQIDNQETRISSLENQTPSNINGTLPNYFKYLSSTDRKNIICGYAEDNHLTHIEELGWSCDVTYRQLRNGRETSSCRCKKI
jgi:hypothetical protein